MIHWNVYRLVDALVEFSTVLFEVLVVHEHQVSGQVGLGGCFGVGSFLAAPSGDGPRPGNQVVRRRLGHAHFKFRLFKN